MKKFIVWVCATVIIIILIAIGSIILYSVSGKLSKPDDNQMITEFTGNKNKYLALLEMIKEDKQLDHLHLNSRENVPISGYRLQDYYVLMTDLKLSSIFQHRDTASNHEVSFTRHFHSCEAIGIVYITANPDSTIPTIDIEKREPYKVYYRYIEPNWYITTSQICD